MTHALLVPARHRRRRAAGAPPPALAALAVVATAALGACAGDVSENPVVVPEVTAACGPAARLVTDVCTRLGGDDGCTEVDDVCIALCDGAASCTTVDPQLRVLTGFPTAPDGYCVVCVTP